MMLWVMLLVPPKLEHQFKHHRYENIIKHLCHVAICHVAPCHPPEPCLMLMRWDWRGWKDTNHHPTSNHQTIKHRIDLRLIKKIANRFRRTPRPSISPRLHDLREFRPSCLGTQPRSCFAASARHSWDRNALSDRWNLWFHIDLICSWNSVHTKVRSYCWFLTSHD